MENREGKKKKKKKKKKAKKDDNIVTKHDINNDNEHVTACYFISCLSVNTH